MAKRSKNASAPAADEPSGALALPISPSAPPLEYPLAVVVTLRRMLSRLTRAADMPRCIAMTAALPEEGVTFTTLALATVLANDLPSRACVVELNWWRPGMARLLAAPLAGLAPLGLADLLEGAGTLDGALVPTGLPNLSLLPAGDLPAAKRAVTARGERLRQIVGELQQRFDHLFLDLPAITLTSDVIPLATLAGACALVVREGVTPTSTAKRALAEIDHVPMLGAILNQSHSAIPAPLRRRLIGE
jgi:Mrp family chromosome partitioning ATPase